MEKGCPCYSLGATSGSVVARLPASVTAGEMVGEGGPGTISGSVLVLLFTNVEISNVRRGCCLEPVSLSGGCPASCSAHPASLRLCCSEAVFRLTPRSPLVVRSREMVGASGGDPSHIMSSCQKTCSKYNLINVLRVSQLLSRSCTAGFSSSQRLSSSTLFALTDCGQCNRSGSAGARIGVLCGSEHSSAYIELEFVQLVIICYMSISISVSLSISPATAELELRAACRGT